MNSIQSIKPGNSLPIERSTKDVQPLDQFAKSLASLMAEPEKPELTADTAKLLMYRSMTTGVPNWEMDKFGGYDAVKEMFEANGGQYDILTIPDDLRRELAQKVSETGVGNMLAAQIENLPIAASAIQALSDAGVASNVIEQLRNSGHDWAEGLEESPVKAEPAEFLNLSAAEVVHTETNEATIHEQNTTTVDLEQAIDSATANAVAYVDSSSYLNSLFKA
jgi:hypothetical protein